MHQGAQLQTAQLREFSEALRYNSPDMSGAHRTVSGATEESDSELASFGNPLRYNSPDMSGVHRTVRCDIEATDISAPTATCSAFNALQSTVARVVVVAPLAHRTVRCAPDMSGEL